MQSVGFLCARRPALVGIFPTSDALQLSTTEIEVGEGQQREYLRAVLGDAAIADFTITKLAFEHAEDILDLGADSAMAPVALLLRRRQLSAWFALLFDGPVNTCCAFLLYPSGEDRLAAGASVMSLLVRKFRVRRFV